jgi:hypothetical protein
MAKQQSSCAGVLDLALNIMTEQMVDSSLETTRIYWRRYLGFPEEVVLSPLPLREIVAENA